ncbi:hypothetical protein BZL43_07940 [Pseudomonas sp. PICF141]|nr:hypothetical protein BZL43_07940 [Pseudomonas sp. PICF141]
MKASQTRIKNSIAEKGVTIDVGARLAGESVLKCAFAGKPGSYEKRFARLTDWHWAKEGG